MESAYGASNDTLTAVYAGSVNDGTAVDSADIGLEASHGNTDSADLLDSVTSSYATAAADALGVVANDGGRKHIYLAILLFTVVGIALNAVLAAKGLKLAVTGTNAGGALTVVRSEKKLKDNLSVVTNLGGIGMNYHALGNGHYASCRKASCLLYLNYTDTASTDLLNVLQVAESRNIYAGRSCSLQDGASRGNGDSNTVDCQIDHISHYLLPSLITF